MKSSAGDRSVRAVRRSLAILICLARSESPISLDQISTELEIPRSTTYRLASTLCDAGFLERGGNARQYRLGLSSAALATAILRQRGSSALIHETLLWLEEQLGETVGISIRVDEFALIIDKVKSRHALAFDPSIGTKLPCFCTAAGRVLLADHTDTEIARLIEPTIEAYTRYTMTDINSILAEIMRIRERGYAVDNQEWTAGLLCVAVPMRSTSGKLTHALAVSAASARTPVENAHSLAGKLRDATALIEPLLTELQEKVGPASCVINIKCLAELTTKHQPVPEGSAATPERGNLVRRNSHRATFALIAAAVLSLLASACSSSSSSSSATASGQQVSSLPTWTFPVSTYIDNGSTKKLQYQPVGTVTKRWSVCVLLPDVFDPYWLAMDYGLVTEAKRDHLSMTVYNGGGYVDLATQVSQMDDCIAAHYNAIIVGAIDATGLNPQIAKAHAAGIPVFDIANGIDDAVVAGHARVSFQQLGMTAATELLQHNQGKQMNILEVPGPEGAVWSDEAVQGIKQGVASDPDAKIVGIRRGDTDSTTTIGLIEDGLKAYPQTNAIVTFDSGAGVAVTAVRDLGLSGKVQVAGFMIVPADWTDIAQGTLLGCPTDFTPILGRIAVDMAVRTLQHEPLLASSVSTFPVFITQQSMKTVNESDIFAPAGFKYVFTVNG